MNRRFLQIFFFCKIFCEFLFEKCGSVEGGNSQHDNIGWKNKRQLRKELCQNPSPMSMCLCYQLTLQLTHKSLSPQTPCASLASCFCLAPESSPAGILNSRSSGPRAHPGGPHALSHGESSAFFWLQCPVPTSPLGKPLLTLQDSDPRTYLQAFVEDPGIVNKPFYCGPTSSST